jgi:plasmid stabilization system protein ParE
VKLARTHAAQGHLQGIHDYIAQNSPRYALAMIDRIICRARQCEEFPLSRSRVPEYSADDIREILEYPYRIIYCVRPDRVEILAVVHGDRRLPDAPP